jgi:hypothetical protein
MNISPTFGGGKSMFAIYVQPTGKSIEITRGISPPVLAPPAQADPRHAVR